jgi:hypothetical protein
MFKSVLNIISYILRVTSLMICGWPAISAQDLSYNAVRREVIESRLRRVPDNNEHRKATLKSMFVEAGCPPDQLAEQPPTGTSPSFLPNVICTLPGTSERLIIVGARYDHGNGSQGVILNWSGASLLPSLYQAIKSKPHRHTYVFLGFTYVGRPPFGARMYATQMTKEQVAATDAMIEVEGLGLGPTEVWSSRANKSLYLDLAEVAKGLKFQLEAYNPDDYIATDSMQFAERKIPTITIHSLTDIFLHKWRLFVPTDRLSAVNIDNYYRSYQLVAAYLEYLDQRLPSTGAH